MHIWKTALCALTVSALTISPIIADAAFAKNPKTPGNMPVDAPATEYGVDGQILEKPAKPWAVAKPRGNPSAPTGYVLCADGTAVAFEIVNGGFGVTQAKEECIARHGGVAAQISHPQSGLTYSEAAPVPGAIPKDLLANPPQVVPEVAAALKDIIRSGVRAEELRGLILKNDVGGIRQLLMAMPSLPRGSIDAIRRAYIGPGYSPVITMIPPQGPCKPSSGTITYWIGGVLIGQSFNNGCEAQN